MQKQQSSSSLAWLWRPRILAGVLVLAAAALYSTYAKRFATSIRRPIKVPAKVGKDFCKNTLPACWEWKTNPQISALHPEVVLVGNELYQQLPTIGYGGIETSVDNIAFALDRMGIQFFAVVPGRREPAEMPFPVLETQVAPNGKGGQVDQYVKEVNEILLREKQTPKDSASKPVATPRNFVVLGQSMWSQNFAQHSLLTIVSHHDGGGLRAEWNWNWKLSNVRHRFLSQDQMRAGWVKPGDVANEAVSRVIPHGLPPEAYIQPLCPNKGYFLWVAGLDWGWEEKGIDIFIEMARRRPQYKFVAFGAARSDAGRRVLAKAYEAAKEIKNFEFRGELKRGRQHLQAFCEAAAFVMPTHESIGESFGMTVIESLSKGVPVIASTNGAVPEILDIEGRRGVSPYGTTCEGKDHDCYVNAADRYAKRTVEDSTRIQDYAFQRFDGHVVVDMMLNLTITAMRENGIIK